MLRVAVAGASGYMGAEALRLLSVHPKLQLSVVTSERLAGERLDKVFPHLRGLSSLVFSDLDPARLSEEADLVFLALPHMESQRAVPVLRKQGRKVIDLSADYRLRDGSLYETWYKAGHIDAVGLGEARYGMHELHRKSIAGASLVANPGCYAMGAILATAPLLTSGLGRAYGIATHRHTPEIEQELSALSGQPVVVSFTPHLVPLNRGIFTTASVPLGKPATTADLLAVYREFYAGEPFVRVLPEGERPTTRAIVGSNFCDVTVVSDPRTGRAVCVSALDNLGKGGSANGIQNLNIMMEWDERTGLEAPPVYP